MKLCFLCFVGLLAYTSANERVFVKPFSTVPAEINPLECTDTSPLFPKDVLHQCNFRVKWIPGRRLVLEKEIHPPRKIVRQDVRIVPLPCNAERCIFKKLDVIQKNNQVDREAFIKHLDQIYEKHPTWNVTRAPVIEECLDQNLAYSYGHCEINRILACVFDVMSENCPSRIHNRHDECSEPFDGKAHKNKPLLCQVNASKNKPPNRRLLCPLPELAPQNIIEECGVDSLSHVEIASEYAEDGSTPTPAVVPRFSHHWFSLPSFGSYRPLCEPTSEAVKCVIENINMTTQYGYLNYMKLRKALRELPYESKDIVKAFDMIPFYKEQCSTPKRLLNVLDSIIFNAPQEKKKSTQECNKLYQEMNYTHIRHKFVPPLATVSLPYNYRGIHVPNQHTTGQLGFYKINMARGRTGIYVPRSTVAQHPFMDPL